MNPVPGKPQKVVAILQSSYIPWKGYFDLIRASDEFVLLDDVQYTRRDWRNRNLIKAPGGTLWLTIPVRVKGLYHQTIKDVAVSHEKWNVDHWKTIRQMYAKAAYFREYGECLKELYLTCDEKYLSGINYRFITAILQMLDIRTKISWSMDFPHDIQDKTGRLVEICRQAKATCYLCGPKSRNYLDETLFENAGIGVRYFDYDGYPEYTQLYPPFHHHVSVVDLIMNEGSRAKAFMKEHGWQTIKQ